MGRDIRVKLCIFINLYIHPLGAILNFILAKRDVTLVVRTQPVFCLKTSPSFCMNPAIISRASNKNLDDVRLGFHTHVWKQCARITWKEAVFVSSVLDWD